MKDVDSPETFDLKKYFPNFLWLLRDAILSVPPGRDGKPMTPTEYLKTKIFKRGASFNETESDRVSRAILTVFPSIECMTISVPSADPDVMRNIAANEASLNPKFNEQIETLVAYLLHHVQPKSGFVEGKLVDGPLLVEIAGEFIKVVNDPNAIPCISDTWQAAVERRCREALEQLIKEYTQDLEAKFKEVGFPMEEDSLDDDPTKPCTLMGIHRSILLEKTGKLLKEVGHFVSGQVSTVGGDTSAFSRESLVAELENAAVVFSEAVDMTLVGDIKGRKRKVVGGILSRFAQLNSAESRSQCLALFTALYADIEEKMKENESYTFDDLSRDLTALQQVYYEKAVGPAKWEVYTEKESFIRSQEVNYKHLEGFKKKTFEAFKKVAEEKARADRLHDSLSKIQIQMSKDAELNKKTMEAMQDQHQQEMARMRKEQDERMEKDREKYEDLMKAQMENMAGIVNENKEEMKAQYELMFKSMEEMGKQNKNNLDVVNSTISSLNTAIENMRKYLNEIDVQVNFNAYYCVPFVAKPGGCFIPGTTVKLSDGRELTIEKQSAGTKILALGGEMATITDEFVQHTLSAGQQIFGINGEAPFAALHHPFWTTEGWKCLDPETAKEDNPDVDFKLLQVGDILFHVNQTGPLLYEPIKIKEFTFSTLQESTQIYGLHLDGARSYHANGYAVMANYPVLTKKRVKEAMKKLTAEEQEHLTTAVSSVKDELTKVLGSWADDALCDMGLAKTAIDD